MKVLKVYLSLYTLLRSHLFVNCCIRRYSLYILWMILFSAEAIFASSTSKFVWHLKSSYRARRFEIIHWINQLHFFDPQHGFRRKLWTSTYLSLESYLPKSKRCWCGEFVKMKIWNLQSLLVCSIILGRVSLTRDDWIFGWRSGLASLILNWCLILILLRRWWENRFWYAWTPWIQFLWIRCWRRRGWICKNVSRYTMRVPNAWRPIFAARHSYRTAQHSTRNWMRWERHRLTGNVGMSTACCFSILKISWIVHTIHFIVAIPVSCLWVPG